MDVNSEKVVWFMGKRWVPYEVVGQARRSRLPTSVVMCKS